MTIEVILTRTTTYIFQMKMYLLPNVSEVGSCSSSYFFPQTPLDSRTELHSTHWSPTSAHRPLSENIETGVSGYLVQHRHDLEREPAQNVGSAA
jgi:hypothetical protein